MTTYTVQGPSGKNYTIDGPAGATADQLGQVILANNPSEQAAAAVHAKAVADTQAWQATVTPTDGMNAAQRFIAGMGKGTHDLLQGAGQRLGNIVDAVTPTPAPTLSSLVTGQAPPSMAARLGLPTEADVAASRQLDAPLMATTAGSAGNIAGKVATALPAAFIPGANGLVGAALIGGAQGALEPTVGDESVTKNALVGAAGGAAGHGLGLAVGAGVRTARAAAEPFFAQGQQRIVGRALNSAAGGQAPAVQNLLQEAAQPFVGPTQPGLARATMGEIVPGSSPTVGQVAAGGGNAGVASLERAATATNPAVTTQLSQQMTEQNAARLNALQAMAGSDGERAFAAANRDETANALYGSARANGIDPAALTPEAQANIAAMNARIPPDVLAQARSLAQIQGMPMDDTTSLAGLHYVKMALDDSIASARASGNATRARALTGLQNDYLAGLDRLSPDYGAARQVYRDMSAPINQMDVAQAITDRAVNPLTGTVQPAAFARALNDGTAARATGFQGATLDNTMTDQQNNQLQAILADVQRSTAAQNAGRGAGSDTVQKLAYTNLLTAAGGDNPLGGSGIMPAVGRAVMATPLVGNGIRAAGGVAARVGDAAYGRQNEELAAQLAQTMLSPEQAAAAMRAAATYDAPNALQQLANQYGLRLLGSTAPALALTMSR